MSDPLAKTSVPRMDAFICIVRAKRNYENTRKRAGNSPILEVYRPFRMKEKRKKGQEEKKEKKEAE